MTTFSADMSSLWVRSFAGWDSPPPAPTGPDHNYPTLLFSWWCTCSAVAIIVARLIGRKVRSNKLFREDWIMMLALIPLIVRQAFIHVVLLYRTNNVATVGYHFSAIDLVHRSIGARLVLAARIFYALFIWISKLTISEFLKRITTVSWHRSYEYTLRGIRVFLFISFGAVVIATLTECQPFDHFWQVIPDPGPQCRTGYANLIAMGTCDILTDILLIAFPIPIVLRSGQSWKRKLLLASLFSLSLIPIAITATRVPEVIFHRGRQQYRTVWASCEILASAAVSNAVILGSFLRDKGVKRNKYRSQSVSDSIERSSVRRPGPSSLSRSHSDEDLFRSLGMRIPEHLRDTSEPVPRPAPLASPKPDHLPSKGDGDSETRERSESEDFLRDSIQPQPSPTPSTKRSMSFFDVGGLLDEEAAAAQRHSRATTLVGSSHSNTVAHDFATGSVTNHHLFGSRAFLQDMGGLFKTPHGNDGGNGAHPSHHHYLPTLHHHRESHDRTPSPPHNPRRQSGHHHSSSRYRQTRFSPAPTGILGPMLERRETQQSLQDAGGLLSGDESSDAIPLEHTRRPRDRDTLVALPLLPDVPNTPGDRLSSPFETSFETERGADLPRDHDASEAAVAAVFPSHPQAPSARPPIETPEPSATGPSLSAWDDIELDDPGGLLGRTAGGRTI